MIDYHQFCQIKDLHERDGFKASQIAAVLASIPKPWPIGWAKSASGLENTRRARVNSSPSRPRFARCWRSIPIVPPRSGRACANTALKAATPPSKPTCARSDPGANRRFSN